MPRSPVRVTLKNVRRCGKARSEVKGMSKNGGKVVFPANSRGTTAIFMHIVHCDRSQGQNSLLGLGLEGFFKFSQNGRIECQEGYAKETKNYRNRKTFGQGDSPSMTVDYSTGQVLLSVKKKVCTIECSQGSRLRKARPYIEVPSHCTVRYEAVREPAATASVGLADAISTKMKKFTKTKKPIKSNSSKPDTPSKPAVGEISRRGNVPSGKPRSDEETGQAQDAASWPSQSPSRQADPNSPRMSKTSARSRTSSGSLRADAGNAMQVDAAEKSDADAALSASVSASMDTIARTPERRRPKTGRRSPRRSPRSGKTRKRSAAPVQIDRAQVKRSKTGVESSTDKQDGISGSTGAAFGLVCGVTSSPSRESGGTTPFAEMEMSRDAFESRRKVQERKVQELKEKAEAEASQALRLREEELEQREKTLDQRRKTLDVQQQRIVKEKERILTEKALLDEQAKQLQQRSQIQEDLQQRAERLQQREAAVASLQTQLDKRAADLDEREEHLRDSEKATRAQLVDAMHAAQKFINIVTRDNASTHGGATSSSGERS